MTASGSRPATSVRLVHAAGRVQIVKDSDGEYEVMGCRPATEYADSALLRVDLKKPDRHPSAWDAPRPWSPRAYRP